jgi:hypothetical protein
MLHINNAVVNLDQEKHIKRRLKKEWDTLLENLAKGLQL